MTRSQFVTLDQRFFVSKVIRHQLGVPGSAITLKIAGVSGAKKMASERVSIKVETLILSESVTFQVHHSLYPWNKSSDYHDIKKKYSNLDVLPDDHMYLRRVKVVLGQDIYHLLFPVAYRKSTRNEPWAVKTRLGLTLSDPLLNYEVAQVVARSHVAAEKDGQGAPGPGRNRTLHE